MKNIKIKICGITNIKDAKAAQKFGADFLGFIFVKKSPRYLTLDKAKEIINNLNSKIAKVGVFADEDKENVLAYAQELKLDYLQFHGKESPKYCQFFKDKFKVIKVLFPKDRPFKRAIAKYSVEAFLFDIPLKDKLKGQKCLSQDLLEEISVLIKSGVKVIISGGLGLDNIGRIKLLKPYAVDVCSSLEISPGKKDQQKVKAFLKNNDNTYLITTAHNWLASF